MARLYGAMTDQQMPAQNIILPVNKGFYSLKLGDTEIEGMAALSQDLLTLVIHLVSNLNDDGINGMEQLGDDRPLRISAYAFLVLSHQVCQKILVLDLISINLV